MIDAAGTALVLTAAGVGLVHTLLGPDHYVPFLAMAKAGRWSLARTLATTLACGIGHVASSLLLAVGGVALGLSLEAAGARVAALEAARGAIAGWLLVAFGTLYMAWGLKRALRSATHVHPHAHSDGTVHAHTHDHEAEHVHVHARAAGAPRMTPWILFTIFVFGPCEPLIPLVFAPAARGDLAGAWVVALAFSATTLLAMVAVVLVGHASLARLPTARLERFGHALAGAMVLACGVAMQCGL